MPLRTNIPGAERATNDALRAADELNRRMSELGMEIGAEDDALGARWDAANAGTRLVQRQLSELKATINRRN